jgi:hypothetical protein
MALPAKCAIERTLMFRAVAAIALVCAGITACGSKPSAATASGSSTTKPPNTTAIAPPQATSSASGSPAVTSSTPQCIGLSVCPPPPPDAEGNPACFFSDGWQANSGGPGIEVWYFHEPQNLPKPDKVTVIVRKKDGTNESQDASIDAGQQTHRFEFPTIDKSSVQEVLLSTDSARCFVIGPGG